MEKYNKRCLEETCHKEFETENYSNYYCSEKCEFRSDARDYLKVISDDEVTCPYCKEPQSDIFEGGYYEAQGEEFECDACGKTFILTANTYTRFNSYPTEEEIDNYLEEQNNE